MQKYIGTKVLEAEPMTRGEYNEHRGWTPPEGEDQDVDGFHVVYPDGYESWSPDDVFTEAYVEVPDHVNSDELLEAVRRKTDLLLGVR
jgi:hypothetical protein